MIDFSKRLKNKSLPKKINPIENSYQSNNKSQTTNNLSYNPNSALLNGKIYKVNI